MLLFTGLALADKIAIIPGLSWQELGLPEQGSGQLKLIDFNKRRLNESHGTNR